MIRVDEALDWEQRNCTKTCTIRELLGPVLTMPCKLPPEYMATSTSPSELCSILENHFHAGEGGSNIHLASPKTKSFQQKTTRQSHISPFLPPQRDRSHQRKRFQWRLH